VPKENVREYMCVCAYVCCTEEREEQEENSQEDKEASISFLKRVSIYAKQAVVVLGDFRELPLLRLIHRIHQEAITVHDKVSLANRRE